MNELVQASLQFPTVVFTIALGIAMVYWVFVLIGALDLDLLGGGHVDLDVAGGHDVGVGGHDVGADGHDVDGGGVWHGLGLGAVPITISMSLILLLCWSGSLLAMHYVVSNATWLRWLVVPLLFVLALPITALLIRPLAPVFAVKEGKFNADYIGHSCTINTGTVDENFGQATLEDGGTVLVISVRCDRPGKLARGDTALIIEFDPARQAYVVEPSSDMMTSSGGSESV